MALDPSIPLSVKPIELDNPLEVFSAIEQVKSQREAAELRRLAGAEAREKRERQVAIEHAKRAALKFDEKTGRISFDKPKLLANLPGDLAYQAQQELDEDEININKLATSALALEKEKRGYRGSIARTIRAAKYDPTIFRTLMRGAHGFGAIEGDLLTRYEDEALPPEQLQGIVDNYIKEATDEKPAEAGSFEHYVQQATTASGKPPTPQELLTMRRDWESAGRAPEKGPTSGSFEHFLGLRYGATPTAQQVLQAHKDWQPPAPPPLQLVSVLGADGKPVLVPESQAVGKTPGSAATDAATAKLPAALQAEIATMLTAEQMANNVVKLGNETGWAGVGPIEGRIGATALGSGGAKGETLRNQIGNIQATIALMRGGTSFTDTEKALLETYTPTITDPDAKIQTKVKNLVDFIQKKRANTLRVASGEYTLPSPDAGLVTFTAPDGKTYSFPNAAALAVFKKRAGIQ